MNGRMPILFAVAAAVALAGLVLLPRWPAAMKAWLLVWQAGLAPAAGTVPVALLGVLTPGRWYRELSRPARGLLLAVPVLALGLLPVLGGLDTLYGWAQPAGEAADIVGKRGAWQSGTGFAIRQIACLGVLGGLAAVLARDGLRDRALAGGAAILMTLAVTWHALDVSMSLDVRFNSTVFGLYAMAGQAAGAIGLLLLLRLGARRQALQTMRPVWLLFGAAALWGYFAFMQYLVVWSGDLPHQAGWYLARNSDGWLVLFAAVCLLFTTPFALLLAPVRRSRRGVMAVAACVLAGSLLETVWRIAPDLRLGPAGWSLAALLALAGPVLATLATRFIRSSREASHD